MQRAGLEPVANWRVRPESGIPIRAPEVVRNLDERRAEVRAALAAPESLSEGLMRITDGLGENAEI